MIIPCLLVTPVTDALREACTERIATLCTADRDFIEAGPSTQRQALRVAQLDLARAGARLCGFDATDTALSSDRNGRPRFSRSIPLHLSVSHCDDALAVAVSQSRIGVDIERLRVMPRRPMTQLFSSAEIAEIIDDVTFTEAWVRKEAYAKWRGTGLCDELASGMYDTDTLVQTIELSGETAFIGLAGSHCHHTRIDCIGLVP